MSRGGRPSERRKAGTRQRVSVQRPARPPLKHRVAALVLIFVVLAMVAAVAFIATG